MIGDTLRAGVRGARLFRRAGSTRQAAEPFFPSHRRLLAPLDRRRWTGAADRGPGGIVVPTSRPGSATRSGLRFAARLALETGRPLVVLASGVVEIVLGLALIVLRRRRVADAPAQQRRHHVARVGGGCHLGGGGRRERS